MRVALAASLLIAAVGAAAWLDVQRSTYSTEIGEQRSITLGDGSTVDLNARARIRVRMTKYERGVELLEGQALFQVAKDNERPFIVRSDGTEVRAVGTQFDVNRRLSGTTVSVVEGRVAVRPAGRRLGFRGAPPQSARSPSAAGGTDPPASRDASELYAGSSGGAAEALLLVAGEQVTVTPQKVEMPVHANVAAATAWTQRRLVFEASPLTQVAEEFNRYTARPLIVEDAELKEFHISGVYSSTDPTSLVRFLREQPSIQITETETEIRISRK